MDYGKLSKKELIEECENKGIAFSSSWTKEKLEDSLIEMENSKKHQTNEKTEPKSNGVGIAGAIVNIVGSSIFLALLAPLFLGLLWISFQFIGHGMMVMGLIMSFIFGGIFIGMVLTLILTITYLIGKTSKVSAGVLGIFFGGLVGGILILCGQDYNKKRKKKIKGDNNA